jgi:MFS family permease
MSNIERESKFFFYGWVVVGMSFLANLVAFGIAYSFSVFFKALYSDFGWTRAVTAGAFSAYAISHDVFAPFAGWLTDKFGPKMIVATGGLCLGGSMIMMSFIDTIWELYIYYAFLFGWGVAGVYTPMMATVSRWFNKKRGFAIGLTSAGIGTGSLALSPFAAWLISCYDWRLAYTIVGILVFIIFIPIVCFIKKPPMETYETNNQMGAVIDFSFVEALRTKSLWALSFSWLFGALALWAVMIHIVALITDKGVSITAAGLLAGLAGGGSIIGRISGGFVSDKLGRKQVLLIAYIFQIIMLFWLFFSEELWMFLIFAPLFGISFGGWAGVIATFPADYFGIKRTGAIFGFVVIMAGVGVAVGSFMGGYIFDVTLSYDYMIVMAGLATLFAIAFALTMKKPMKS